MNQRESESAVWIVDHNMPDSQRGLPRPERCAANEADTRASQTATARAATSERVPRRQRDRMKQDRRRSLSVSPLYVASR